MRSIDYLFERQGEWVKNIGKKFGGSKNWEAKVWV